MSNVEFLLTTEVKGKNIQPVEKAANFCLAPVRYLWNGRKVDLIQKGSHKAIQYEYAYSFKERNDHRFVIMIVLLVPGAVIGIVLKIYAHNKYHDKKEDEWIQSHLKARTSITSGFAVPQGDSEFGEFIKGYLNIINIMCPKKGESLVFLSEIETLMLNKPISEPLIDQRNMRHNQAILHDLGLLWNLKTLFAGGHYDYLIKQNVKFSFDADVKKFRKELPELTMRV